MAYLFYIPLRGTGTSDVEALGSYVQRLSLIHGVTANKLMKHTFSLYSSRNPNFRKSLPAFHSSGSLAIYVRPNEATHELAQVLAAATGVDDIRSGTFLALRNALHRSVGAFSRHFRWCPSCMDEFRRLGDSGYYKLQWHLEAITHCHIHGCELVDRCSNCGSYQDGFGLKTICRCCIKCGAELSECGSITNSVRSWELNGVELIELVEEIARDHNLMYLDNSVQRLIIRMFDDAWEKGEEQKLWKQIPRDECLSIVSGHKAMTLNNARRIAFYLGVRLTDLLHGDIENTPYLLDPDWGSKLPEDIRPKKRIHRHQRDAIYEKLLSVLDSHAENKALPLREVARQVGVSVGYLHYHFPVLCKRILDNHRQWKNERKLDLQKQARQAALEFFTQSIDSGKPQSRKGALRILRQETGLPKHVLRKEINTVYEIFWPPNEPPACGQNCKELVRTICPQGGANIRKI